MRGRALRATNGSVTTKYIKRKPYTIHRVYRNRVVRPVAVNRRCSLLSRPNTRSDNDFCFSSRRYSFSTPRRKLLTAWQREGRDGKATRRDATRREAPALRNSVSLRIGIRDASRRPVVRERSFLPPPVIELREMSHPMGSAAPLRDSSRLDEGGWIINGTFARSDAPRDGDKKGSMEESLLRKVGT